jgi:hypothetical protein
LRSLVALFHAGGEAKHFAEQFVELHQGDWLLAKDHWTRAGQHIGHKVRDLDLLSTRDAAVKTEQLARTLCLELAQLGACWACRATVNR